MHHQKEELFLKKDTSVSRSKTVIYCDLDVFSFNNRRHFKAVEIELAA